MIIVCVWLFVRNFKYDLCLEIFFRRKVLVLGVVYIKGLYVVKILVKVGYYVVLVDVEDFWCFVVRWFCFILKFYIVLNLNLVDNNEVYISGIIKVVEKENVDWYVLVSYYEVVILDVIVK